jgi:L-fuconolactonase
MRGIGVLKKFDFTYDILIFQDQLKYIPQFVQTFTDQKFVIDHLAKPNIKEQQIEVWKKEIKAVAQFPNVWCKVSGMVTEADWPAWENKDFEPYLDAIVDAFGIERIMYGSDWPVCLVAATYEQQLVIVKNYFYSFSKDEQEKVFGGNAIEFYKLK